MADLNPFGGNFNLDWDDGDTKNALNYAAFGLGGGMIANSMGFDLRDPFGTKALMEQQQNMLNQYRAQQEALMRDEANRRWQSDISNSWAAFGAQRRSQVTMNGIGGLGPMSANDIYLGGR